MNVVSARTLDEALRALKPATEKTRILAGGTDLMVEFEAGRTHPDLVVDIWKLDELRAIREENGGVRIGSLASCTELLRSTLVCQVSPASANRDPSRISLTRRNAVMTTAIRVTKEGCALMTLTRGC